MRQVQRLKKRSANTFIVFPYTIREILKKTHRETFQACRFIQTLFLPSHNFFFLQNLLKISNHFLFFKMRWQWWRHWGFSCLYHSDGQPHLASIDRIFLRLSSSWWCNAMYIQYENIQIILFSYLLCAGSLLCICGWNWCYCWTACKKWSTKKGNFWGFDFTTWWRVRIEFNYLMSRLCVLSLHTSLKVWLF